MLNKSHLKGYTGQSLAPIRLKQSKYVSRYINLTYESGILWQIHYYIKYTLYYVVDLYCNRLQIVMAKTLCLENTSKLTIQII